MALSVGCGPPEPAFFEATHRFVDDTAAHAAVAAGSATLDRDTRPVLRGQPFLTATGAFTLEPEAAEWPRDRHAVFESPELLVPAGAWLEFSTGVLPDARNHGPVEFRVSLCEGERCSEIHSETLDPAAPGGDTWHDRRVPLASFRGRVARFRFELRHRQRESAWFSLPVWADPVLYAAAEPDAAGVDFVLFSIDTLGARHLPTYGYDRDTAPFIDQLAARGTVFEHCVAPATTTGPSHMTLFTSLPPSVHDVMGRLNRRLSARVGTLAEALREHGFATGAVTGDGPLAGSRGFARGFGSYVENTRDELHAERGQVDVTLGRGRAWLERQPRRRFFLFLHTFQVHGPYSPPEAYQSFFAAEPAAGPDPSVKARARERAKLYDQEIRYVDDELAGFYRALEDEGIWEHTVLILVSDHGEAFGEHGSGKHGPDPYEEVLRVPCLVVGPGIAAGRRVKAPVSLGDLMPTLLELAGATVPPALTGRSLAPVLRGGATPDELWERPVFAGAFSAGVLSRMRWPSLSVRVGHHKLVRRQLGREEYRFELYDLENDPDELEDLSRREQAKTRELRAVLEAFDEEARARRRELASGSPAADLEADPLDAEREQRLRALGYLE